MSLDDFQDNAEVIVKIYKLLEEYNFSDTQNLNVTATILCVLAVAAGVSKENVISNVSDIYNRSELAIEFFNKKRSE